MRDPVHTLKAKVALMELQLALSEIPLPHPAYPPGAEPTAYDACRQIIEMIGWGLEQISTYVDVG